MGSAKTYKREVAVAGLAFWAGVTVYLFVFVSADKVESYRWIYDAVSSWTWMFAIAAYGVDAIGKQVLPVVRPNGVPE